MIHRRTEPEEEEDDDATTIYGYRDIEDEEKENEHILNFEYIYLIQNELQQGNNHYGFLIMDKTRINKRWNAAAISTYESQYNDR